MKTFGILRTAAAAKHGVQPSTENDGAAFELISKIVGIKKAESEAQSKDDFDSFEKFVNMRGPHEAPSYQDIVNMNAASNGSLAKGVSWKQIDSSVGK